MRELEKPVGYRRSKFREVICGRRGTVHEACIQRHLRGTSLWNMNCLQSGLQGRAGHRATIHQRTALQSPPLFRNRNSFGARYPSPQYRVHSKYCKDFP